MKTSIFKSTLGSTWQRPLGLLLLGTLLCGAVSAHATTVNVLGGGAAAPFSGYKDGGTFNTARFNNPQGIALDPSGTRLFVADYTNNAIRLISSLGDNAASQTLSVYTNKDGINRPVSIIVDSQTNIYVLNAGTNVGGGNLLKFNGHYLLKFDYYKYLISSNSFRFTNATAMAMDGLTNIYITSQSNRVLRVNPAGTVTTVGVITNAGTFLRGVAVLENGNLALTDAGNNGIWLMNPYSINPSNNATKFTGFNGVGDLTGTPAFASFNRPENIAVAGKGVLIVADRMNHKVKQIDSAGNVTRVYGVRSNYWGAVAAPGKYDGTVNYEFENLDPVQAREPFGVAVGADGSVYATEDYYHIIRKASATGLTGPGALGTPPLINSPAGIALNNLGDTLYIADPTNNVVYKLNLGDNTTTTFLNSADGIYQPVDVAVDSANNLYVLNQGTGSTNGSVYVYDEFGNFLETYIGGLTLPTALNFDLLDRLYVASLGGQIQSFSGSSSNTIVTITTNANVKLQGIAVFDDGKIAVSDAGNHVIWLVNPVTQSYSRLSGAVGLAGSNFGTSTQNRLNTPQRMQFADGNKLVVADSGNNRLVIVQSNGSITNSLITTNGTLWFGRSSDPVSTSSALYVAMANPIGVAIGGGGVVYASEATFKDIRAVGNTGILPPPGPPAPPAAPTIGYVTFVDTGASSFTSKLIPVVSQTFNNDVTLAIFPATNGNLTYYTSGPNNVPDPTATNGTTPPPYADGLFPVSVTDLGLTRFPTTIIRAASVDSYGSSSAITLATFQFVTANPSIVGNNAAQFTVSSITTNAQMFYTTDGSDPTNAAVNGSIGPITSGSTLSLNIVSNTTFKIRAFRRPNFQDSGIVTAIFSPSNFVANTISFGFASGEASSDFVASPGQIFYAPVTLSLLPAAKMYSLQFNITATNLGAGPAVLPNSFSFTSMLKKPDPANQGVFLPIPPYAYAASGLFPAPNSSSLIYQGDWYQNLLNTNSGNNLLTVGWLERLTQTNLYNTKIQDLVTYSLAHDVLFSSAAGKVEVGGYSLFIPSTASPGQSYRIQIGRPSATADGIGAPGSDVFIAAPTNGSYGAGLPINAVKNITIGQRKYLVGDAYPFRWFNAGDFGDTNLNSVDLSQVFQSAVYGLNTPPTGSDFYDVMDSSGFTYVNNGNGYLEVNAAADQSLLYDGNDTTINQIAFGDGILDVSDVYVTYRRSLDPSLNWFRRFWTNGVRVAEIIPNVTPFAKTATAAATIKPKAATASTVTPRINFFAGDIIGSAGQTVQIPITAKILGNYPARVLMLNLTVQPLDGSPALTTQVQFTPTNTLGTPTQSGSIGNGNYSAAWLNSTIAGLSSNAYIGTLSVTIPATASSAAAYAIHFDHASASPNGLASFPKQTLTGLVTLSARTNSTYGDGIPDSWRLRWFGTANNFLSASNACPSGDGVSNYKKFVAGVDPNVAGNFPSVNPKAKANTGYASTIHWPTVSGKQYVIERSTDLFAGWSAISTNTGTGGDLEYNDANTGKVKFYRVRIQP